MKGIYIVGGYPTIQEFENRVKLLKEKNFDFVEIGIPFSEPVADGEIISKAIENVIENNISTIEILNSIKKFKAFNLKIYLMTYSNIFIGYGLKKFSESFKDYVDSVIIADLPNKMHEYFYSHGFDIPIIPFVTPESRKTDIEYLKNLKGDFIYFIGIRGITGGKIDFEKKEIKEKISEIRNITGKKVIIGFGIKNRKHTRKALKLADGFVIGTEAVRRQNNEKEFKIFIETLNEL